MGTVLALLLSVSMQPQILSQILTPPPAGGGGGTVTFVASGEGFCNPCSSFSFSLPATTSTGHLLVLMDTTASAASDFLTSVTGGGTWVIDANCQGSALSLFSVSCAYVLSSTSGTTSISVTSTSGAHAFYYYDYSCSATLGFDTSGNASQTSSAGTQPGVTLSPTGLNDVIFQSFQSTQSVSAISAPYGRFTHDDGVQAGWGDLENSNSGTAPTWTIPSTGRGAFSALAIKCQ